MTSCAVCLLSVVECLPLLQQMHVCPNNNSAVMRHHYCYVNCTVCVCDFVMFNLQSTESDTNRDGRNDALSLSIRFTELSHKVHTVKLLLFFRVQFTVS